MTTLLQEAKGVILMFDQANTNGTIESLGSRGVLLKQAVDDLRKVIQPTQPPAHYDDERFCEHCDKDTPHTCEDTTHERDSSGDYQECKVCGWHSIGHREYSPPLEELP
jgi:hypothetical protein